MKMEIAAGARTYSMRIAVPVRKPPHGPSARRAKPYPPPAVGRIEDSSASENTMQTYMMPIRTVAIASPPKPPSARPKFQPEKSPETTYATPRPVSSSQPALPRLRARFCR